MDIGSRVVIKPYANYRGKYTNEPGTVTKIYKESLGISLDKHINNSSRYGVFWFKINEVELLESEVFSMIGTFKVAGINFQDGTNTQRTYWYALYDNSISVGDMVVVQTGHHGLAVATVVSIESETASTKVSCGREIIGKVDTSSYEEHKAKAQKMAELKRQMDIKVQQLQQTAIYELLSEKDSELAALFQEYKKLMG